MLFLPTATRETRHRGAPVVRVQSDNATASTSRTVGHTHACSARTQDAWRACKERGERGKDRTGACARASHRHRHGDLDSELYTRQTHARMNARAH